MSKKVTIVKRGENWKSKADDKPVNDNLRVVPSNYSKKTKLTKSVVTKSFRQAHYKMLPTKEIRFDDVNLTMNTNTQPLASHILSDIAGGVQDNQRLAHKLYCAYAHIKGTIANNDTKYKTMRIMVVKERTHNAIGTGTPIPMTNLFKASGTTVYTPAGIQKDVRYPLNKELVSRIYDKVYKVPPETQGCVTLNLKIPIRRYINYQRNQTGVITTDGRLLFLAVLSDIDNAKTASTSIFTSFIRVFFKDASE